MASGWVVEEDPRPVGRTWWWRHRSDAGWRLPGMEDSPEQPGTHGSAA